MKKYIQIFAYLIFIFTSCTVYGKHCLSCYGGGGGGSGGTYNCTINFTLYVDQSRPDDSGNGFTWATAKKNLQAAIYIANECSVITSINVARGTYKPSTTTSTAARDYTFFIGNSYSLRGGYPAGGGVRDWVNNPTILDGNIGTNYESYHVLVVYDNAENVTIDGFRIRNGFADGPGSLELDPGISMSRSDGSGLYIRSSPDVDIKNCVIYDNVANGATSRGAGYYSYASDVDVVNTVFANNLTNEGGGLYMQAASTGTITNCTFYGNYAAAQGGAIYNTTGTILDIVNTIVWGNSNAANGGGTRNVSFSIWQGGNNNNYNFNIDPEFNNTADLNGPDNIWMNDDDGLIVCKGSLAINRGNNYAAQLPTQDIKNDSRKFNSQVDIGAYELQAFPDIGVDNIAAPNDSTVLNVFSGITPFSLPNCNVICLIKPTDSISEKLTTVVKSESQTPFSAYTFGQWFVLRHYDIQDELPYTNHLSTITLYFTNSEFSYYNTVANLDTLAKLPDANNLGYKSKLRVVQFKGSSPTKKLGTYSGSTVIIDPIDTNIQYNATTGYWKVTFDAVGFGGFFVTALNDFVFNDSGSFSDPNNWLNNEIPTSALPAYNTITIQNNINCIFDVPLKLYKYSQLTVK